MIDASADDACARINLRQAVQFLYQGQDAEARKAAEKWLRQLQRKPEGWAVPMCLLDSTKVYLCDRRSRTSRADRILIGDLRARWRGAEAQ